MVLLAALEPEYEMCKSSRNYIAAVLCTSICIMSLVVRGDTAPPQEPILYPDRIAIPEDIKSVEELRFRDKSGINRSVIVLPTILYLEGHYDGWQTCLRRTMQLDLEKSEKTMVEAPASFEPYTFRGERDGYNACLKHLSTLVEDGLTDAELKEYCHAAYRPLDLEAPNTNGLPDDPTDGHDKNADKGTAMKIQYLEIVTPDVDAACVLYSRMHGVTFGDADRNLGGARTAKLVGGGMLGIRAPLRDTETSVVRPYVLVEDIKASVAAAAESGAQIAMPPTEISGYGQFAIVFHGGIESGLWQL